MLLIRIPIYLYLNRDQALLATFVITLREGLEAALIIAIIASFLNKNQRSLTPLWLGVIAAVVLSLLVGIVLHLSEQALPQQAQEGMETIIAVLAIIFISSMLLWMQNQASNIKKHLQQQASLALSHSGHLALCLMAFLAVLREGFETSVFLLATFAADQSTFSAASGAILGLVTAIALGLLIYHGSVRINLRRLFSISRFFLILVAAGLVIAALRSAHEAGWLSVGQQRSLDLSTILTPGSVTTAIISGLLVIPADPRHIELTGWCLYITLMMLRLFWPDCFRLSVSIQRRWQLSLIFILIIAALGSVYSGWLSRPQAYTPVTIITQTLSGPLLGKLSLSAVRDKPVQLLLQFAKQPAIRLDADQPNSFKPQANHQSYHWQSLYGRQSLTLSIDQLVSMIGGKLPAGINPARHKGPFQAQLTHLCLYKLHTEYQQIIAASANYTELLTITGGGLTSRTLRLTPSTPPVPCHWQTVGSDQQQTKQLDQLQQQFSIYRWRMYYCPALLLLLAFGLFIRTRQQSNLADNNLT